MIKVNWSNVLYLLVIVFAIIGIFFLISYGIGACRSIQLDIAPDEIKYDVEVVRYDTRNKHYFASDYSLGNSVLLDEYWEYYKPTFWWQDGHWEHKQATVLIEGGEAIIMELIR